MKHIEWNRKPISKPGIYFGVPLDHYHGANLCDGPSVSSSGLRKIFNESPAHYWATSPLNPNRVEEDESPAFVLGRAVHHLILGEPFFAKLFCVRPTELPHYKTGELRPWHGNNTECKSWLASRAVEGRTVLTPSDVDNIKGMAAALGKHPLIRAGALNGAIERSIVWKDKETGIWCKARPDTIPNDSGDFTDLKTTPSVQWTDLMRSIGDFAYHQQGALIRTAAREVLDIRNPTFTLVFVEKKAPWCVRVVTIKDADLDRGEKQNRAALRMMADCLASGKWPGPGGEQEDAEYIELSDYAQRSIDEKLTILGAG